MKKDKKKTAFKRLVINELWLDELEAVGLGGDDAAVAALFKYIVKGEMPEREEVYESVAPVFERVDNQKREREEARLHRTERARSAREERKAQEQNHAASVAPEQVQPAHSPAVAEVKSLSPEEIFGSFPDAVRRRLALREMRGVESESYQTFRYFLNSFPVVGRMVPADHWMAFKEIFPETWPECVATLQGIYRDNVKAFNKEYDCQNRTPEAFFKWIKAQR